ncbi:oxidoreductase [Strigomonas culicis]|uniref:Oxidoreductase n=1 Tax=Strigomonas culicis TaxID=28005 RepID=S9W3C4_9TRYP|nr:oxidoreductase [Strigomonas culicis]|eukprot:EPY33851.1 oxidoreductase [Strigomonas culicis]
MMRAVTLKGFGAADLLSLAEVPRARLRTGRDVLIKVMASGINRADIVQRYGKYPPPPGASEVLGLEVSGVVDEVGSDVKHFKPGDKVMALLDGGGYAEYAVAHEGTVMPMPREFSFIEAAAVPEAFLTAWQCLKYHGDVQPGQRVLIHAGASGVGTALAQLVERHFKATAITTSSAEKVDVCKSFASHALDRTPDEAGVCFASKVKAQCGEQAINLIIDPVVGGTYLSEDASVLANDGKIVVLALMGGTEVQLNLMPLFARGASIVFSKLRNKPAAYKEGLVTSFTAAALPPVRPARAHGGGRQGVPHRGCGGRAPVPRGQRREREGDSVVGVTAWPRHTAGRNNISISNNNNNTHMNTLVFVFGLFACAFVGPFTSFDTPCSTHC